MNDNFSVYLRKPVIEDKDILIAAYNRSKDLHEPYTFAPLDIDRFLQQEHRYLLCHTISDNIVGTFNISNIVRGWFQSAYLGYEIFAPFQKQGFMYQGMQLIIDEAFIRLNLHRLEANIQADNIASIKLVEKSGFTKEGFSKNYLRVGAKEWKDHERWAIVNTHWQEKEMA